MQLISHWWDGREKACGTSISRARHLFPCLPVPMGEVYLPPPNAHWMEPSSKERCETEWGNDALTPSSLNLSVDAMWWSSFQLLVYRTLALLSVLGKLPWHHTALWWRSVTPGFLKLEFVTTNSYGWDFLPVISYETTGKVPTQVLGKKNSHPSPRPCSPGGRQVSGQTTW